MKVNHVLGIIYSNAYDEVLGELTAKRTMGSVPFAGRYRLIDFVLSGMVNCDIDDIGVITKRNFQSLMDHIGTGKAWDLSRKTGGLSLLPPFNTDQAGEYRNKIDALNSILPFIKKSVEEYVLLTDCNIVGNPMYAKLLEAHTAKGADITVAYRHGKVPNLKNIMTFEFSEDERVTNVAVNESSDEADFSMNAIIINKELLEKLIQDAASHGKGSYEKNIIQANVDKLKIYGYKVENFCLTIDSLESYYKANMALLDRDNCRSLFDPERPIYTKLRDDMPTTYGISCKAANSLIADGCLIEGEIENCVLSRGVKIEKGAKVKNSIIMQDAVIKAGADLNCVILDKNVVVGENKTLSGSEEFPVYVGKNKTV